MEPSNVPPEEEFAQPKLRLTLSAEPHMGTRKQDMNCGTQWLKQKSKCQTEVREASYTTTLSVAWDLCGVDGMWMDEDGASMEWCWQAKAKVQGGKPVLAVVLWSLQHIVCVCVCTFSPHYTRMSGVSQEPEPSSFSSCAPCAVLTSTLKRNSSFLQLALIINFMDFWK
jgi:hypothetical protein